MFQNLAENIIQNNNEDVNSKRKIRLNLEHYIEIFKVQHIIIYVLSFLISTVSIRDGLFPFGFAFFVAACSSTIPAGPVLIATLLGTLVSQGISGTLIYVLSVLVFLFTIVILKPYVQDDRNEITKLGRNLIISSIIVQAIKLFIGTFLVYDAIIAVLTIMLTYIFYKVFVNSIGVLENIGLKSAFTIEEIIGATIIAAVSAVAVSSYRIFGISIANIISIFVILVLAWKNGVLVGSTIGISVGLILGIIGVVTPIQVLAFSISGMLAGLLNKLGKSGVIIGFFLGNAIISYLSTGRTVEILLYREFLIAAVGILFVPKYIQIDVEDLIGKNRFFGPVADNRLTESISAENKLANLSNTVKEIAQSYGMKNEDVENEIENINISKETFIEDLLNNLDSFPNNILYEELIDTNNGLIDDIYMVLTEKEEITKNDIIKVFEKRNEILDTDNNQMIDEDVEQVVRIINRTYRINEMNFQWKTRLSENKKAMSKQLNGVSKAISEIAEDISKEKVSEFSKYEIQIKELLKQKEILIKEIRIRRNKSKKFFIDILFEKNMRNKEKIKCVESILSKVCKEKVVFQKDTSNLDTKIYMQRYTSEDKFVLQLGMAQLAKTGNDVCGDSCIQIKLEDNKHMVALSDGMGSGIEAKKSSQIVIKMLKQTLSAGFDKEDSMELINSTIKLSQEEIYSTMDVVIFDLYKGICEFIKNGSCRTYIKNKQSIDIVESNSLPLGILNDVDFTVYDRDMNNGDILIMCSDGIIDSNAEQSEDKWLIKLLKEINTNNVKKMADIILREAIDNGYGILKDDMTVIVAKVESKIKLK